MLTGPIVSYPGKFPMDLVRAQCAKTPDATAVLRTDRTIRYRDLDTTTLGALVKSASPALCGKYQFLAGSHHDSLDTPAYIAYTSGTMGERRPVLKTHRNIVQRLAWDTPNPGELQLVYPHGLPRLMVCLMTGAPVALTMGDAAGVDATLRSIGTSGATHITLWSHLLDRLVKNRIPLGLAVEVVSIGAPLSDVSRHNFMGAYPHIKLVDGYGSTEAGWCMRDWEPVANTTVWVDAPEGAAGSLCIQGPTVGQGYASDPVKVTPAELWMATYKGHHILGAFASQDQAREVDGKIQLIGRGPRG